MGFRRLSLTDPPLAVGRLHSVRSLRHRLRLTSEGFPVFPSALQMHRHAPRGEGGEAHIFGTHTPPVGCFLVEGKTINLAADIIKLQAFPLLPKCRLHGEEFGAEESERD